MRPVWRLFFRCTWRRPKAETNFNNRRPLLMMTSSTSAILYAAAVSVPNLPSGRPDDSITSGKAHHKKGEFHNPWDSAQPLAQSEFFSLIFKRRFSGKMNIPDTSPPTVPVVKPEFLPTRETKKLRATWLGHACFYVEFPGGLRVLFDPVFEDRCSPFSFLGPKRYTPPPCEVTDLPFVDAVVISHNHYDHLSHSTTLDIKKKYPNVHFFVPLGNKKWFNSCGVTNVTEMDWWDEVDLQLTPVDSASASAEKGSVRKPSVTSASTTTSSSSPHSTITARISCLPCQHFSARTPFDRNHTLWASWAVRSGPTPTTTSNVYFGGDTGYRSIPLPSDLPDNVTPLAEDTSSAYNDYVPGLSHLPVCPAFRQIGELRGPFDLGLIPIGAYAPRFLFSWMHANPQDAVRIFLDTRCRRAVGIHWGTWVLTEEEVLEPKKRLSKALDEMNLSSSIDFKKSDDTVFGVTDIGESREYETGDGDTKTA